MRTDTVNGIKVNPRTLYDKIVDAHAIRRIDDRHVLLYIDRHILNEYTSPQAFTGLRHAGRKVWRPEGSLGVVDHVNPTVEYLLAHWRF